MAFAFFFKIFKRSQALRHIFVSYWMSRGQDKTIFSFYTQAMENRHKKSSNGFDSDLVGESRALRRWYARKESNLRARRPEPKYRASNNAATRASRCGTWASEASFFFIPLLVNAESRFAML